MLSAMSVEIARLADLPHFIPVVAQWHWDAWGAGDPDGSLAAWTEGLRSRSGRDRIPISWVALVGPIPAGSVALNPSDMVTHPELSPWLSGLFVVPEQRSRGIGSLLTTHCERWAVRLGVDRLHLYTDAAEAFYARRGWKVSGREWYEGTEKTLMWKDLPAFAD
jgi:GNAT superfamily N-acetyltransferase